MHKTPIPFFFCDVTKGTEDCSCVNLLWLLLFSFFLLLSKKAKTLPFLSVAVNTGLNTLFRWVSLIIKLLVRGCKLKIWPSNKVSKITVRRSVLMSQRPFSHSAASCHSACKQAGGRIQRCHQCLQQRQSEADTGWMCAAQGSATTGTLPSCALNGNQTGRSSNTSVILPHGHISRGKRRGTGACGRVTSGHTHPATTPLAGN